MTNPSRRGPRYTAYFSTATLSVEGSQNKLIRYGVTALASSPVGTEGGRMSADTAVTGKAPAPAPVNTMTERTRTAWAPSPDRHGPLDVRARRGAGREGLGGLGPPWGICLTLSVAGTV